MFARMTIREMHSQYINALTPVYGGGEAAAITGLIFEHFLKLRPPDVFLKKEDHITFPGEQSFHEALQKLLQHMPVQQVTRNAWFYSLNFSVNEAVLIPRPETEELVHKAISFLKTVSSKKVLDVGTGSGCIAISIKKNVADADVTAVDISGAALNIAKQNALVNDVDVDFRMTDFLQEDRHHTLPVFDVIISNPPYIPVNEKELLDKNVTAFEPHIALFVPQNDPLIFYKKIKLFARDHLKENGKIFLEVHEEFAKETAAVFTTENYTAEIKKDIPGKERMVIVTRCR